MSVMDSETRDGHEQRLARIRDQIRGFFERGEKVRIFHGFSNTTRSEDKDPARLVDVSLMDQVIEINTVERFVVMEPSVTMAQLVEVLAAVGFAPPVVPEFPGITVGGAIMGGAGESSSFRYGCFHESCLEYEVVLADGSVVTASADERRELFDSLPCSYGSIGVLSLVKMRIVPAAAYVELTYHRVDSYSRAVEMLRQLSQSETQFVDGIMYAPDCGVVMTGRFCTERGPRRASFSKWTDDWFYTEARKKIKRPGMVRETIELRDYFFRYDRGIFWMGRYGFEMLGLPFTRLTRGLLIGLIKTQTLYPFMEGARLSQGFVVQDVCLPVGRVEEFMAYNEAELGIFPLWLCPLKSDTRSYLAPAYGRRGDLVMNVGVWGRVEGSYEAVVARNRSLEAEVAKLGGRKVLYAHAYYSPAEFGALYDLERYEAVRRRYGAETVLPTLYDKVTVSRRYEPSVMRGIMAVVRAALTRSSR